MKMNQIAVGQLFHDGKSGLREVISITSKLFAPSEVEYAVISARAAPPLHDGSEPIISRCELATFARWAKRMVPAGDRTAVLTEIAATKIRLRPPEKSFLNDLAANTDEAFKLTAGASLSFVGKELRVARSIAEKGLLRVSEAPFPQGGMVSVTELGACWFKAQSAGRREARA